MYDGQSIVLVYDGSGSLVSRYLQGVEVDQALAEEDGSGTVHWMLPDDRGSVRDVVDSSGTLLNNVVYDGFGQIVSQSGPTVALRFGYTGRERDAESGLWYYRRRYYDASVGQFIGQDPLSFGAGDTNLYRYVGNSTPNGTDPSGLESRWNRFWGNVGAFYANKGIVAADNMNAYYNGTEAYRATVDKRAADATHLVAAQNIAAYYDGTPAYRAAVDARAAQSWIGASALTARGMASGVVDLGETAIKADWDARIKSVAAIAESLGYDGVAAKLRAYDTGTLTGLPGKFAAWLAQQRKNHAKRVQVQVCKGKSAAQANLLATGLTLLKMLGIGDIAEGIDHFDFTEQKPLSDGEAKLRTVGGVVQVGSWVVPSVASGLGEGIGMSSFRYYGPGGLAVPIEVEAAVVAASRSGTGEWTYGGSGGPFESGPVSGGSVGPWESGPVEGGAGVNSANPVASNPRVPRVRPDPITDTPRQAPGFKPDPNNNVTARPRTVNQFLDDAVDFLGDGYTQGSDGAFYSANGAKRVRFTDSDLMGHKGGPSHGHFEFNGGRNVHVPLTDK